MFNYTINITINGGKNMTTVTQAIKELKSKRYRTCRAKSITLSDKIVEKSETIIKWLESDTKEDVPFGVYMEFVLEKFYGMTRENSHYIKWLEAEKQ